MSNKKLCYFPILHSFKPVKYLENNFEAPYLIKWAQSIGLHRLSWPHTTKNIWNNIIKSNKSRQCTSLKIIYVLCAHALLIEIIMAYKIKWTLNQLMLIFNFLMIKTAVKGLYISLKTSPNHNLIENKISKTDHDLLSGVIVNVLASACFSLSRDKSAFIDSARLCKVAWDASMSSPHNPSGIPSPIPTWKKNRRVIDSILWYLEHTDVCLSSYWVSSRPTITDILQLLSAGAISGKSERKMKAQRAQDLTS